MYQISHTKPAEAAAQILMTITKEGGYWWVHADEDEGFRMASMNSADGNRLARSGSPSLAGPFDKSVDIETLAKEIHKAQRIEFRTPPPYGTRTNARHDLVAMRQTILDALVDQDMTVKDMAVVCGATAVDIQSAINTLRKYGRIKKAGRAERVQGGVMNYWKRAA